MRLPLAVLILLSLLPAHARAAAEGAPSGWFNLSIPDGSRTLTAYGIACEERALTLTLLARQLFGGDRDANQPRWLTRRATDDPTAMPSVGDVVGPPLEVPAPQSTNTAQDGAWRELTVDVPRDQVHRSCPSRVQGRRVRLMTRWIALVLVACAVASDRSEGQGFGPGQNQTPRPQFETRAELVLVDITVIDDDGKPATDLTKDDFMIDVNGRPRDIESVQFIAAAPTNAPADTPRHARFTANDRASGGRLLLMVVDEGNLRFGAARTVLRTADMMLTKLAPGDLVGLARLPEGAGGVEFTTDRERVRQALSKVTGKAQRSRGNTFTVRLSEAMARERSIGLEWDRVIERECAGEVGPMRESCASSVEAEAQSLVAQAEADARRSISALEGLLSRLAAYRTPTNIILISEGLFVARDRNVMSRIAERAAAARVSLHIVQPGQSIFDVESLAVRGMPLSDDQVLSEGLEMLAGQTRGALYKIEAGSGAGVFDRLSTELSGYYLLGFAPTDEDRTGQDRRIRVRTSRRGLRVRARPTFAIKDVTSAATMAPDAVLTETLKAPLPSTDVPMRVATYNATSSQAAKIRVVVSAEIGEPTRETREWPVGVIAVDANGKIVAQSVATSSLSPARDGEAAPALFLTSLLLDPGDYSLRVAAVTPDGRAGSVHHPVPARLVPVGARLTSSDLIVSSAAAGEARSLRPSPTAIIEGETAFASIEIGGSDRAALGQATVAFEIAESETSAAIVTANSEQQAREGGMTRAFAARVPLGVLPPGEYVARAIITVPGAEPARITRPFLLATTTAATASVPPPPTARETDDEGAPPPPTSRILAPVPRFAAESALDPRVVRPFLDALVDRHPPSAAVAPIVEQARSGTFVMTTADAGSVPQDELMLAFIRGLAALQKRSFAGAAGWFQQTLRGASDFLGAAYYLGACHAARGQDREAVGAWQLSLLGEGGEAVYPVLVDALLRLGDGPKALELLEEAPDAWVNADDRLRRHAMVDAMLGRYQPAMDSLRSLLERHPQDLDLLFVAVQVLYRKHLETPLDQADITRFTDYVMRYQQGAGPQIALVDAWRKYVMR